MTVMTAREKYNHDIVVKKIGRGISRIDSAHRMKEPLMYPLLFPYGTPGYGFKAYFHQRKRTKKITAHEYLNYRLYRRDTAHDMHLQHGKLTQEWILSSYLQIEKQRMDWLRYNQGRLRADKYACLRHPNPRVPESSQ